jgi:heme/copper-type cytochrome/quinol oxidase subunit 2
MLENERPDIYYYIKKLRHFGLRLRMLSLIISLILLANIVTFVVFAASIKKSNYSNTTYFNSELYLFLLAIPIVGIFTLFFFNTLRKQGMTYYEEVTDEMSWSKNRDEYLQTYHLHRVPTVKQYIWSSSL